MQLLKFGQVIDLDVVDAAYEHLSRANARRPPSQQVSLTNNTLTHICLYQEIELKDELIEVNTETEKLEAEMKDVTMQNTELLMLLSDHAAKSLEIQRTEDRDSMDDATYEATVAEGERTRMQLMQQIEHQSKTILELKTQLLGFTRKDAVRH